MYLKQLSMSGFKSFANPVHLDFDSEISAIVGPNGSGKSNISDAIRFVLGEQSTRQMRSQKMEDIIFSGTDSENARGAAEVQLTLEQTDAPDLIISRKFFRTGESKYQINGKRVRLRDIHELFVDTGLGKNGYSIVSQGKIESIIESNPSQIKEIVEEAVGIAGYKNQREETNKRLLETQENIDRVSDLLEEIKKLLKPAKKRMEKTLRFLEINEILRNIDLLDFYYTQKENYKKLEDLEGQLKVSESLVKDLQNKADQKDKAYLEVKEKVQEAQNILTSKEESSKKLLDSLSQNNSSLAVDQNSLKFNIKEQKRLENDQTELKKQILKKENDFFSLKEDLIKQNDLVKSRKALLKKQEDDFKEIKQALDNLLEKIANEERKLKETEQFNKKRDKRREALLREKTQISTLKDLSLEKIRDLQDEEKKSKNEETLLNQKLSKLKKRKQELEQDSQTVKKELDFIKSNFNKIETETRAKKEQIIGLESKYNYLTNLKKAYAGYNLSIKNIMQYSKERPDLKVYGPVGELFLTEQRFLKAIEVALGSRAQNIIVDNEETTKQIIDYLKVNKKGRATFLPLKTLSFRKISKSLEDEMKTINGFIAVASELIQTKKPLKKAFEALLGRVVVLNDFNSARNFRKSYPNFTLVTLTGEIFYPGGAIVGGQIKQEKTNSLFKTNELNDLNNEIKSLKEKFRFISNKEKSLKEELSQKELEFNNFEKKILENRNQIILENSNLESLNKGKILNSIKDEEKKILSYNQRINDIDIEIQNIETSLKEHDDENILTDLRDSETELKEEFINENIKLSELKVKVNSHENKLLHLKESFRNSYFDLKGFKKTKDKIANDLKSLKEVQSSLKNKIDETIDLRSKTQKEIENLEIEKIKSKEVFDSFLKNQEQLAEKVKDLNKQRTNEVEAKVKIEHQIELLNLKKNQLQERIFNEYHVTFAVVSEQKKELEKNKLELNSQEIKGLRKERKSLGYVSTEAVDEYNELSERYKSLKEQYQDLVKAEDDIKATIEKINISMKEKLNHQFKLLNKKFSKTFSILFEGGRAYLDYIDPEDILNSGIILSAQPPGKNLKNLSLLSGGEKAMTAIALLFSFIELNPAPFTIIDGATCFPVK